MDISDSAISGLRRDFPGWNFVYSDRGRYWANRGPLPDERLHEVSSLEADTSEQLRRELAAVEAAQARPSCERTARTMWDENPAGDQRGLF